MTEIFVFFSVNESQVLRTSCTIESAQIFAEWINSEPEAAREEGGEAKREHIIVGWRGLLRPVFQEEEINAVF